MAIKAMKMISLETIVEKVNCLYQASDSFHTVFVIKKLMFHPVANICNLLLFWQVSN